MINYYKLRLILISGLFIHWCNCFYKIAATVVEDVTDFKYLDNFHDLHL